MVDVNKERQKAIRDAWKNEKANVRQGMGTRDWSQVEQRQIVAKGRANGYEGHHMKSVKEYPQYAGDPKNIQFLNRSEHVNGAHKGNTQNPTNGYYDHKTGKTHDFGNRPPQAPQSQALSSPLTQRQQSLAVKREQAKAQASAQAKAEMSAKAREQNANKGIESARQKSAQNQTANPTTQGQSSNKGIKNFQSKTSGQIQNPSKSNASNVIKSASASNAVKPTGSGNAQGSGQAR